MSTDNKTEEVTITAEDENKLIAQRREKLAALRVATSENGGTAFPNTFRRDALAGDLLEHYQDKTKEELEVLNFRVAVAGRMMAKRVIGKASFSQLQDMSGRIQLFYSVTVYLKAFITMVLKSGMMAILLVQEVFYLKPKRVSYRLKLMIYSC